MTFHFSEDTEMASMEFEYLDIAAVLLERIWFWIFQVQKA
jgi:hypothetical protein